MDGDKLTLLRNTVIEGIKLIYLLILPFISITGARLYNSNNDYSLLLILIIMIAIVPIMVLFELIPEKYIILCIITVSLSLLYCTSLITDYLWGSDIHGEYYFSNLVNLNSFWDSKIPSLYNAMLSVVMLAPIMSIVSGIDIMWVLKLVYPMLYVVVPLVLYIIYEKQTSQKVSFLAVILFTSVFTFYTEMIALARQQIGEIFLALIILVIVHDVFKDNVAKRKILLYVFGASLVLSHYTLSYLFAGFIVLTLLIPFIMKKININFVSNKIKNTYLQPSRLILSNRVITVDYLVFLLLFIVIWYVFISETTILMSFVTLFLSVSYAIWTEFLNPESVQGLYIIISGGRTSWHQITKILHIAVQVLISIGIIKVSLDKNNKNISYDFFILCLVSYVLDLASIVVPFLSSSLNTSRIYHITLIFLSPFCVIGFNTLINMIGGYVPPKVTLRMLSLFLAIFLVFNTGFFYTLAGVDRSIADPLWAETDGDAIDRMVLYNAYTPLEDIVSAKWLNEHREPLINVYSDYRGRNNPLNAYGMISRMETKLIFITTESIEAGSYVYLRKLNIIDSLMDGPRIVSGATIVFNSTVITSELYDGNIIYSNGGSYIIYTIYPVDIPDNLL